jgi:hypothetical protein
MGITLFMWLLTLTVLFASLELHLDNARYK